MTQALNTYQRLEISKIITRYIIIVTWQGMKRKRDLLVELQGVPFSKTYNFTSFSHITDLKQDRKSIRWLHKIPKKATGTR